MFFSVINSPTFPVRYLSTSFFFSLQVLRNINDAFARFVTPCDLCSHPVRFLIIVPCPNVHLLCTQCLIHASHQGSAFTRRSPLTACPQCSYPIHGDFFDRLQPPVQTRRLFVVRSRAERRRRSIDLPATQEVSRHQRCYE